MRTMSARDAKNRFGELLMEAQKGPVAIEKHGRPAAVVISWEDHERNEELRTERLRALIREGIADLEAGRVREWDDELMDELTREPPSTAE